MRSLSRVLPTGFVGQWDDRTWNTKAVPNKWPSLPLNVKPDSPSAKAFEKVKTANPTHDEMQYTGLKPGFIKRDPIAWYASHHHTAKGENAAYSYSYLFAYEFDVPPGAKTLTLPDNSHIRIVAVTAANSVVRTEPATPLYDVHSTSREPEPTN